MICIIWLLAGVYAFEYMKHEQKPARFFMFYTMSLGALMSLCFSADMMTLYLSYEYMTILTLPLVYPYGNTRSGASWHEISGVFRIWLQVWG